MMFEQRLLDRRALRSVTAAFSRARLWRWETIAPRVCTVSLAASISLCATRAGAQAGDQAKAPGAAARAESLFESGLELQRLGQLEQACQRFESSAELAPSPHALLQVGNCREPQDPVGALASFEAALAAAGKVTD